jgi:hypothetical protein
MSVELKNEDLLVCPHCNFEFDDTVSECKTKDGIDRENADEEYCPECGQGFLIIKYNECYVVEAIEEEDDDDDEYYADD